MSTTRCIPILSHGPSWAPCTANRCKVGLINAHRAPHSRVRRAPWRILLTTGGVTGEIARRASIILAWPKELSRYRHRRSGAKVAAPVHRMRRRVFRTTLRPPGPPDIRRAPDFGALRVSSREQWLMRGRYPASGQNLFTSVCLDIDKPGSRSPKALLASTRPMRALARQSLSRIRPNACNYSGRGVSASFPPRKNVAWGRLRKCGEEEKGAFSLVSHRPKRMARYFHGNARGSSPDDTGGEGAINRPKKPPMGIPNRPQAPNRCDK